MCYNLNVHFQGQMVKGVINLKFTSLGERLLAAGAV